MMARRGWLTVLVLSAAVAVKVAAQNPPRPDTLRPRSDSAALPPDTTLKQAIDSLIAKAVPPDLSPPPERIVWLVDDYPVTRARLAELDGGGPAFPMARSTSSLFWLGADSSDEIRALMPQLQFTRNSAMPYSRNDGGLWAGRGWSSRISGGVAAKLGILRVIIAPEIITTQNDSFPPRIDAIIPTPVIPPGRSSFSIPWYANGPYSVDMPLRFGSRPRRQLRPGQSSVLADVGAFSFGFSTENEWWGPGIDNALVMSNNAPGFPHLLIRSSRPLETLAGKIEFRWLVGGLTQSAFFDTATNRTTRSLASAVVTIRPRRIDDLSLGLARSVVGTSTGWGEIPFRWLDVLRNTGHPNDGAPYDSTLRVGGRDQLYSVFARWVVPRSGAEVYGEWGRLDFPRNLRDMLVQPNRGLAYMLGLQWTRDGFTPSGRVHFRMENTSLEQSLATRNRFAGVWYTSRRVLQGFTNEGQVLGAAVGPGSSGQIVELNYYDTRGVLGVEFGRTRYNEDVHQASPMLDYLRWCSHDVGLQWGFRGGVTSRFGTLVVRSLYENRLHPWFQGGHGCPRSDGMVDVRNRSLTITFSPLSRW
jgi:hypothetical protein